jgi:hypothetical protein
MLSCEMRLKLDFDPLLQPIHLQHLNTQIQAPGAQSHRTRYCQKSCGPVTGLGQARGQAQQASAEEQSMGDSANTLRGLDQLPHGLRVTRQSCHLC